MSGQSPQIVQQFTLTPMHRFRQLDPSWFRRGQTTSLLVSVMEKEDVKEDRGGILTPPCVVNELMATCDDTVRGSSCTTENESFQDLEELHHRCPR
jgi:hypothetical protein